MALTEKGLVLAVVTMSLLCGVTLGGSVHKVGGSAGWTTKGNIDYSKWASSQNFIVGDTLVFEYNKQYHNVMQVSLPDFRSCNMTSSPIATYTSGSDSIAIKRTGHFYFLCGVPGHCQAGQKVDVRVTQAPMGPSHAPSGSPAASPSLSLAPTPGAQSDAPFLGPPKLLLALGFVAALVCLAR